MRVFYAIRFNEEIKDKIFKIENNLKDHSLSGNYTLKDNLHLTLRFIGEVENEELNMLIKVLNYINNETFQVEANRIGEFARGSSSISWLGINKSVELDNLYKNLELILQEYGWQKESRRFAPHITLGRKVKGMKIKDIKFEPIIIEVDNITLMKSKRVNGVLKYLPIQTKNF